MISCRGRINKGKLCAEDGQDERHVFSGELHAAIGLYDFH